MRTTDAFTFTWSSSEERIHFNKYKIKVPTGEKAIAPYIAQNQSLLLNQLSRD
jgi:hypothetical protein